jgi:hypothetical protein
MLVPNEIVLPYVAKSRPLTRRNGEGTRRYTAYARLVNINAHKGKRKYMQKVTGEMLANQANLGDVVTWRLHWLICDIHKIQEHMTNANFLGEGSADLSTGVFAGFVEALQGVARSYARLRWEAKTMLGRDYPDEVEPLFDSIAKHAEYLEELETAKKFLEKKAQQILAAEATRIQGRLDDLAKIR